MEYSPQIRSLLLLALCLWSCTRPTHERTDQPLSASPEIERPNIILIDIDSLGAELALAQVDGVRVAPALAGLEKQGLRFSNTWSQGGWTEPAMQALLTGKVPLLFRQELTASKSSQRYLPEILGFYGYHTAVLWEELTPKSNLVGQFQYESLLVAGRDSPTELLDRWIGQAQEPYFLFLSLFDLHFQRAVPHEDLHRYVAPLPDCPRGSLEEQRRALEPRLGAEGALEHVHGHLLGALSYYDSILKELMNHISNARFRGPTLIVFVSNHGDDLAQHVPAITHRLLLRSVVHVPLVIVDPRLEGRGQHWDGLAELVDVAPTLLELAGIPRDTGMSGRSLAPILRGERPDWSDRTAYGRTEPHWAYLYRAPWHLIMSPWAPKFWPGDPPDDGYHYELYDVASDQGESKNLFEERAQIAKPLLKELRAWDQDLVDQAGAVATGPRDAGAIKNLRDQGYWKPEPGEKGPPPGVLPDERVHGPPRAGSPHAPGGQKKQQALDR